MPLPVVLRMLLRCAGTACKKRQICFYACWSKDDARTAFLIHRLVGERTWQTFSRLFEIRHSGDYDDFVYCEKEMTDEYTPLAEAFIQRIKELLEEIK